MKNKLSKEELKELFLEFYQSKDLEKRNIIIEENLYIAEILAKKFLNRGIEYDDLFQVASLALVEAVNRFDPTKGFAFSTFATPTIVGEIKKHFRDKGWVIRVPRRIQELSKKVNNAKLELAQSLLRTPKVSDIAKHLNISEEEVIEAIEGGRVYALTSLETGLMTDGEDELNFYDFIGEEDSSFKELENEEFINQALNNLNEMERSIIINRYFQKKTQIEIAKELNISQMTVSRIEKRIIKKIKKDMLKNSPI